jgi:hypothetical protein
MLGTRLHEAGLTVFEAGADAVHRDAKAVVPPARLWL